MLLRLKVWKHWNKKCINSKLYKFLVLLGIRRSPSFYCYYMSAKRKVKHGESLSDIPHPRIITIDVHGRVLVAARDRSSKFDYERWVIEHLSVNDVRKLRDGLDEILEKLEA